MPETELSCKSITPEPPTASVFQLASKTLAGGKGSSTHDNIRHAGLTLQHLAAVMAAGENFAYR